jgi:glycosyltransferase involved in cell wall biosynthesis
MPANVAPPIAAQMPANGLKRTFHTDPFPGRPRILFIGLAENSHTHSWIDLLAGAPFNVRLFARPSGIPPADWKVRTYITRFSQPGLDPATRSCVYPRNRVLRTAKIRAARYFAATVFDDLEGLWLARIIKQWKPHIIHTLGLVQGGEIYYQARQRYGLEGIGKWVLQTRGGSDLTLPHFDPERRKQLAEMLGAADQIVCDNRVDLSIACELGARDDQIASIAPVPGTGGIDVDGLKHTWNDPPSARRAILWPKAYDSAWGKMLGVFEALKLCWDKIQPCEIHMLSMNDDSRLWFWTLPEAIRQASHPRPRLPRAEVLDLMPQARVMLAPALTDGVPNSLYEAMACGAFPIVSPLETIFPVVENELNVLFARTLYPHEIATALTRAMTDDALVDAAAQRNLEVVGRVANRATIGPRVIEYYERLAQQSAR